MRLTRVSSITPPLLKSNNSFVRRLLISIPFLLSSFSPVISFAQTSSDFGIPDSVYAPNQLIVWFRPGILNPEMIGGYGDMKDYPYSEEGKDALPLDISFINSEYLVTYFSDAGVIDIRKVVPWIDPLRDTLSITRNGDTIKVQPIWNLLLLTFDPSLEIDPVYEAYRLLYMHYDKILYAQPNFIYYPGTNATKNTAEFDFEKASQFNDPYFIDQISLQNSAEGINVENAWNYNTSNSNLRIGVIDNGLYTNNTDFSGGKMLYPTPIDVGSTNGIGGKLHGTDMAGIICARSDNGAGVCGIAGGSASNLGAQFVMLDVHNNNQIGYYSNHIYDAFVEASMSVGSTAPSGRKGLGCQFINASFYSANTKAPDQLIRNGVAVAYTHGVVVSACMGNDNSYGNRDNYPADVENPYVIAVGAKGEDYLRGPNSNSGDNIDLVGPGHSGHIFTTYGIHWANSGGETSAATAHTTGVAVLLGTDYNNSGMNVDKPYDVEDIENLLEAGCVDDARQIRGQWDNALGWGYLNAYNSLTFLHDPYVLRHYEYSYMLQQYPAPIKTLPGTTIFEDIMNRNTTYGSFSLKNTQVYKITVTAPYTDQFQTVVRTWSRGNKHWNNEGFSPDREVYNPPGGRWERETIMQAGYSDCTSYTNTNCELETYFYRGTDISGLIRWVPFDPLEVQLIFSYSILGIPQQVGIEQTNPAGADLNIASIYPNPVIQSKATEVSIMYSITCPAKECILTLTDNLGRTVRNMAAGNLNIGLNNAVLNLSGLPSGLYLLSIQSNGLTATRTISVLN